MSTSTSTSARTRLARQQRERRGMPPAVGVILGATLVYLLFGGASVGRTFERAAGDGSSVTVSVQIEPSIVVLGLLAALAAAAVLVSRWLPETSVGVHDVRIGAAVLAWTLVIAATGLAWGWVGALGDELILAGESATMSLQPPPLVQATVTISTR